MKYRRYDRDNISLAELGAAEGSKWPRRVTIAAIVLGVVAGAAAFLVAFENTFAGLGIDIGPLRRPIGYLLPYAGAGVIVLGFVYRRLHMRVSSGLTIEGERLGLRPVPPDPSLGRLVEWWPLSRGRSARVWQVRSGHQNGRKVTSFGYSWKAFIPGLPKSNDLRVTVVTLDHPVPSVLAVPSRVRPMGFDADLVQLPRSEEEEYSGPLGDPLGDLFDSYDFYVPEDDPVTREFVRDVSRTATEILHSERPFAWRTDGDLLVGWWNVYVDPEEAMVRIAAMVCIGSDLEDAATRTSDAEPS